MPSERHRSKEDTWSTNELKRALNKDEIRKERERLKRERRDRDGRDEEEIDTRKREGHRRREDDDRKERKKHEEERRHNRDDDRRRKDDDRRSHRTDNDEEERERQRRERRERREGKSSRDTKDREQSKRKEEDESRSHKRQRDTDDKHSRDHDDRRRRRDEEDEDEKERRRQEDRERRRREKEGDKRHKDRDRDRDKDDRRQTNGEGDDRHRRHKDQDRDQRREKKERYRDEEDERDRRRDRRDEDDEDERERQRRERRERREGKDKDRSKKTKDEEEEERRRRKEKERREREEKERQERERQERQKSYAQEEDDYNDYEDDFEDYEDDFEDEEEAPEPPRRSKSPDNVQLHRTAPHGVGKAFDYADKEVDEVLRALDQENERLLSESRQDRYDTPETNGYRTSDYRGRYRDEEEEEEGERGGWGSSHQTPSASSSGLINFSTAKKQVMSRKSNSKTAKRAADLLQMLELDVARYDMFDLPPVKEYELYIRSFGRTDAQQAYVQTNDDNIEREIQTEEIDTRQKWTQHPPEDYNGCGRGDGEKDLDDEEEYQQNKQYDLARLNKFVEQAGQVIAILLDEEKDMSKSQEVRGENRSNMAVSEGFTQLNMLSLLKDRYVEFTHFSPSQPNYLLTVYSKPTQMEESNPVYNKGIICVWNTNEPSYPQRILACESQPVCCCFSPYKATLVFAGMVDGSVCAWDLREPPSLHQTLQYDDAQHIVRFPTYNTAGVMDAENHHSPVTTLNPVVSSTDREPDTSDSTDESLGLSFQLVSCEEQGVINFWVVAEISNPDMAGSEVDLGLSPGGRVKLVRSSVISLQSPVGKGSGAVRSFELQLSPQDPNHFYVGTEGGYILHGVRFGSRAFPRTFSAITDAPADVQRIDFSPFGHPCFLASSADGAVHLFNSKTDIPLVTWPAKTWGGSFARCVRWSRIRPCVFYVLDNSSHLYTFDILEGDVLPAKIDTLSSTNRAISMSLTDHRLQEGTEGHSTRLPQMVVSFENGTVEIHTISKEYRELQTLETEFIPSYLARF